MPDGWLADGWLADLGQVRVCMPGRLHRPAIAGTVMPIRPNLFMVLCMPGMLCRPSPGHAGTRSCRDTPHDLSP